jgi:predicted acyltransferase
MLRPFRMSYRRLASVILIAGWSNKTTFNKELWTSIFPLYSIKPNLRNLFMKKITRDHVR